MNCFGRSGSCSSNCSFALRNSPEIGDHGDTTLMDMHHCRIFICISKILGNILGHQFCLRKSVTSTSSFLPLRVPTISYCPERARNRRRSSEVKGDEGYHVSVNERGEIEIGSPIKIELVMDQLVSAIRLNSIFRKLEFGDIFKGTIARSIRKRRVVMGMLNWLICACLSSETQDVVRIDVLRDSLAFPRIWDHIPCEEPCSIESEINWGQKVLLNEDQLKKRSEEDRGNGGRRTLKRYGGDFMRSIFQGLEQSKTRLGASLWLVQLHDVDTGSNQPGTVTHFSS